jgi:hypothetical protein
MGKLAVIDNRKTRKFEVRDLVAEAEEEQRLEQEEREGWFRDFVAPDLWPSLEEREERDWECDRAEDWEREERDWEREEREWYEDYDPYEYDPLPFTMLGPSLFMGEI